MRAYLISLAILATALVLFVGLVQPLEPWRVGPCCSFAAD
jgi:hypothetical protein